MWKALDFADAARFCNAHGAHATTIDAVRIGLTLQPDNPMLYVYRAAAYDEFGRSAEAIADCEAAIRLGPRGHAAVLALITLALVRERIGDHAGALAAADEAIAIEPRERQAHACRGTLLAWRGDYERAWPELECHWIPERLQFRRRFPDRAEWNGEPLAGRRVLLVHNQGLGDFIQMLRYLPQLRERASELLIECAPSLRELVRPLPGISEVLTFGTTPRERFDVFARAMTLPRLLGETGAAASSRAPYLTADASRMKKWAPRLTAAKRVRRVGIAWAGNSLHDNDRRRSIPLESFAPFAEVPGVEWFSLQYGPHATDPAPDGLALSRLFDEIRDMADTAAIVAQLDLVISVDTSVAHLAGALGTPVWLLLPWRPDWRWSPSAADTPWYPAMRLFHAAAAGWPAVLSDVTNALYATSGP